MSKVSLIRKNKTARTEYKLLTRRYFSFLCTQVRWLSEELYDILDSNLDCSIELYRHSLCNVFKLESNLAYDFLEPLVEPCSLYLSAVYDGSDLSIESRKALIQICMHCVIKAKNNSEKVIFNV